MDQEKKREKDSADRDWQIVDRYICLWIHLSNPSCPELNILQKADFYFIYFKYTEYI